MRNVKDCHLAEAGGASLVITCSSDEILTNATQAFEQVTLLLCQQTAVLLLMFFLTAFNANGQCTSLEDATAYGETCNTV